MEQALSMLRLTPSPWVKGLSQLRVASKLGFDLTSRVKTISCQCPCGCKEIDQTTLDHPIVVAQMSREIKDFSRMLRNLEDEGSEEEFWPELKRLYRTSLCRTCDDEHREDDKMPLGIMKYRDRLLSPSGKAIVNRPWIFLGEPVLAQLATWIDENSSLSAILNVPVDDDMVRLSEVQCMAHYLVNQNRSGACCETVRVDFIQSSINDLKANIRKGDPLDRPFHVLFRSLMCNGCYDLSDKDGEILLLWKENLLYAPALVNIDKSLSKALSQHRSVIHFLPLEPQEETRSLLISDDQLIEELQARIVDGKNIALFGKLMNVVGQASFAISKNVVPSTINVHHGAVDASACPWETITTSSAVQSVSRQPATVSRKRKRGH